MIPLMCRSSSRARAGLVPWQMRLYPSPLRPGPIPAAISLFLLRKILRAPVIEPHGARVITDGVGQSILPCCLRPGSSCNPRRHAFRDLVLYMHWEQQLPRASTK